MATVTHRVVTPNFANQSAYTSDSFTPAQGDLLIGFAIVEKSTAAGSMTASGNGITFTEITSAVRAGTDTVYAFVANQLVPSSPSSMTVTMNVPGGGFGAVVAVASVAGMIRTGATAIRQSKSRDNASSGTPQIVFNSTPITTNVQLGVIGNGSSPAGLAPPASWSEGADAGYATGALIGLEYAYRNSGGTTATITWGSSSSGYGGIIVELDSGVNGTAAPVQASQTASATGILGNERIGTAAPVQASQTGIALGRLGYSGAVAVTQANQTTTTTGLFIPLGTGVGVAAQADNIATASGWRGYKLANSWIEPVGDPIRRAGILHPVDVSQQWVLDSARTFFEGRSYPVSARGEQVTAEWSVATRWPTAERLHAEVFLELLREIAQQDDARITVHIAAPPNGSVVEFVGECHEVPQDLAPSSTDFTLTFRQVDA